MQLADFDFVLPEALIAQQPAPERDRSKLLVVRRETGSREHREFHDLPDILGPQHLLVLNNTRVFPARLRARRTGREERIEVLLVRQEAPRLWIALLKPARKAAIGQVLEIDNLRARVEGVQPDGARLLHFEGNEDLAARFEQIGETPLPPYIRRPVPWSSPRDRERYQTVYAVHSGSVAAPTAGLHFTREVIKRLQVNGIGLCEILLHVGYGTFQPVRTERIESHRMLPEYFQVGPAAADAIVGHKAAGKQLIAVGTTTTRVLEYLASSGTIRESSGFCNLFIYPGFQFKAIDGLLTNFHLPKSTLFMLVCALAGRDLMLDCYREAMAKDYRFFSYGDCMLIL